MWLTGFHPSFARLAPPPGLLRRHLPTFPHCGEATSVDPARKAAHLLIFNDGEACFEYQPLITLKMSNGNH